MAVCRYFQQGICKFGNRCRFEHTYSGVGVSGGGGGGGGGGGYPSSSGTSVFNRNKSAGQFSSGGFFSPSAATHSRSSAPNPDMRDLMQMVITELTQSERGGQWPLSCFAPFKEQCCFPGLEDHSPEELRYVMYEANKLGNLEDCKRKIKELYGRSSAVKHQIMNPNAEVYSVIEKMFKGQKVDFSYSPLYAPQLGGSSSGILSQTPVVSSSFTFSLSQGNQNVSNVGSQQPLFSSSGGSITHPSSSFSMPVQNATPTDQNIFRGFNQPSVVHPFGNNMQPTTSFQQSPSGDSFNSPLFKQQPKGVFNSANANQNKGIFEISSPSENRSILSGNSVWNQPSKPISEDTIYTPLSELSEEEKNIFNLKTFTMGKVPTKAPAKELCL